MEPAHNTSALLADLSLQYQSSCFLLAQLETSLKYRGEAAPDCVAPGPVRDSTAFGFIPSHCSGGVLESHAEEDENDQTDYEVEQQAREEEEEVDKLDVARASRPSSATMQPPPAAPNPSDGKTKIEAASFLHGNELSAPVKRLSVIDMSSVAPNRRHRAPRRAASLYSLGSVPLQPSSALSRRTPLDFSRQPQQQQQQLPASPFDTPPLPRRSYQGALGPSAALPFRLSSERSPACMRWDGGGETPAKLAPPSSPRPLATSPAVSSSSSLPGIHSPAPPPSPQLQQALQDNFTSECPSPPVGPLTSAPQQPQPLAGGGDGWSRRRPASRRGSDYVCSPLGSAGFSAGQQTPPLQLQLQLQLQPTGSPSLRPSLSSGSTSPVPGPTPSCSNPTCLMPTAISIPARSPLVGQQTGGSGGNFGSTRVLRRSGSNTPLQGAAVRPSGSRGQLAACWKLSEEDLVVLRPRLGPGLGGGGAAAADGFDPDWAHAAEQSPPVMREKDDAAVAGRSGAGAGSGESSMPAAAAVERAMTGRLPKVKLHGPPARTRSMSVITLSGPTGWGSGSSSGLASATINDMRGAAPLQRRLDAWLGAKRDTEGGAAGPPADHP